MGDWIETCCIFFPVNHRALAGTVNWLKNSTASIQSCLQNLGPTGGLWWQNSFHLSGLVTFPVFCSIYSWICLIEGKRTANNPVHVPWDTFLLILFSALLLLLANSFGMGWEKLAIGRDSAAAGAFKEGKNWVSQLKVLLRNLRSVTTHTEDLTPMSFWNTAHCSLPAAPAPSMAHGQLGECEEGLPSSSLGVICFP